MNQDELCNKTLNQIDELMRRRALGEVTPSFVIREIKAILADHQTQETVIACPNIGSCQSSK